MYLCEEIAGVGEAAAADEQRSEEVEQAGLEKRTARAAANPVEGAVESLPRALEVVHDAVGVAELGPGQSAEVSDGARAVDGGAQTGGGFAGLVGESEHAGGIVMAVGAAGVEERRDLGDTAAPARDRLGTRVARGLAGEERLQDGDRFRAIVRGAPRLLQGAAKRLVRECLQPGVGGKPGVSREGGLAIGAAVHQVGDDPTPAGAGESSLHKPFEITGEEVVSRHAISFLSRSSYHRLRIKEKRGRAGATPRPPRSRTRALVRAPPVGVGRAAAVGRGKRVATTVRVGHAPAKKV